MATSSAEILRSRSLRVTNTREKILDALRKNDHAASTHDIEVEVDHVDRITLYRTLKAFEEKGIIHKVVDGTGYSKYAMCEDACQEAHHHDDHVHFHCEDCGNTFCVEDVKVPYIKSPSRLKVKSTSIVLNGTCDKCGE